MASGIAGSGDAAPRVAVVTGGIGGLGTAMCIALANAGRRVVALDLERPDALAAFRPAVAGLDVLEAGDLCR